MNPKQEKIIEIDINKIPVITMNKLSAQIIKSIREFYADPENQRKFELWKESKNEKIS